MRLVWGIIGVAVRVEEVVPAAVLLSVLADVVTEVVVSGVVIVSDVGIVDTELPALDGGSGSLAQVFDRSTAETFSTTELYSGGRRSTIFARDKELARMLQMQLLKVCISMLRSVAAHITNFKLSSMRTFLPSRLRSSQS